MEPLDDRIAERLAEIREQERERDRRDAEREAAARDHDGPVVRPKAGAVRSFLFLTGVLALAAGLLGVAVTLSRLAGADMADARREGQATVNRCVAQGPISNRGFGYWESCEADVVWDGNVRERVTVGVVFGSADIGRTVRVGDLGQHRGGRKLARADATPRPWLLWLGYGVGAVGVLPAFVGVLLLREVLRPRRR